MDEAIVTKSAKKRQYDAFLQHLRMLCRLTVNQLTKMQLDSEVEQAILHIQTLPKRNQKRALSHLRGNIAKDHELWQQVVAICENYGDNRSTTVKSSKQLELMLRFKDDPKLLEQWLQDQQLLANQEIRNAVRNFQKYPDVQKYKNKLQNLLFH